MYKESAGKHRSPKTTLKLPAIFPANTPPRRLLIFFSSPVLLIASALSGVGFSLDSPYYWVSGTLVWIAWFAIMFTIVSPGTNRRLQSHIRGLNTGAKVIFSIVFITGILELFIMGVFSYWYVHSGANNDVARVMSELQSAFRYNDGTALNQQATENLLAGKNPYANANIVTTFIKFNGSYDRLTPLRTGQFTSIFPYPSKEQLKQLWESAVKTPAIIPPEIESNVSYPAGSFLLPAPFIAAGLTDIRLIYFIFVMGGLIYAVWLLPKKNRLIFIGLAVISLEIWNILAVGESGVLIFPFLLIAWMTAGKNDWLSAIFMGIAAATRQTSWFFLPFYLILMWHSMGEKSVLKTIGIIAGIFIAFNVYFIWQDPKLWLQSVTSPMASSMFPLGVGIYIFRDKRYSNYKVSAAFFYLGNSGIRRGDSVVLL